MTITHNFIESFKMSSLKAVFIIDKIEFRYFEMNDLVTSFWLINESNLRGWDVYITTLDKLSLNNNNPEAFVYKTKIIKNNEKYDLAREKEPVYKSLNSFDLIMFRPDPPVNMDYINATYILDYVNPKTLVINNPSGIRKANEKLYINNFPELIPQNLTTSDNNLLKDFVNTYGEIIIKPLNKCFGKGVFYLKKGDKNINSILDTATNNGTTAIMAQEYIDNELEGDKRLLLLGGELLEQSVIKVSGAGDFKFNTHNDKYLKKCTLTEEDRKIGNLISSELLKDGLFLVGLDVINDKIIEINVTSPCFFIREINSLFGVQLEKRIMDYIENLLLCKKRNIMLNCK